MQARRTNSDAATPAPLAGQGELKHNLRAFLRLYDSLEALAAKPVPDLTPADAVVIHKVRVASRRTTTAMVLFRDFCPPKTWRKVRRHVRAIRRAAGEARDTDVHLDLLHDLAARLNGTRRPGAEIVLSLVRGQRDAAQQRLRDALAEHPIDSFRQDCARLVKQTVAHARLPITLGEFARASLAGLLATVREAASHDITDLPRLHALRLNIKQLRYAAEILGPCLGADLASRMMERLKELQTRLGEANDIDTLLTRLTALQAQADEAASHELSSLIARYTGVRDLRVQRAHEALGAGRDLFAAPPELLLPEEPPAAPPEILDETPPLNGEAAGAGLRLAVIDIGSASIRLFCVETIGDSGGRDWRVLAEERSMTRLAHGLAASGSIAHDAIIRSAEVIARMKSAAERCGANIIRAFATAAVREAANGPEFVALVRQRTGITIEIVSARDEGRLVFQSAARVFDVEAGPSAVADLGGGSLEVVSGVGGVITGNVSMPLGAVRLTEAFGGAAAVSGPRFGELKDHIREQIENNVSKPETPPRILVGCGGTFTTLASLAAGGVIDRGAPPPPVALDDVKKFLRTLRDMPLEERLRFPGLPADRADIVIAALAVVERLMKRLGAEHIHIHRGGVREGLLLKVLAERTRADSLYSTQEKLRTVRDFAAKCHYERPHAEHVAALSLSIFDQLAAIPAFRGRVAIDSRERTLLEAAAVLHDVGCLVEYKSHHKHALTMIRHADLTGWEERDVEIVALIARYHRRASPTLKHDDFAALNPSDRDLTRRLAAILRIADGLDRSHTQQVRSVTVTARDDDAHTVEFTVRSGTDPAADIDAARNKSDLFTQAFTAPVKIQS